MGIFYLDDDPTVTAQAHCDRHLGRMLLDTAQILSTAWQVLARQHEGAAWVQALECDWSQPQQDTPFCELSWLHTRLCGGRIYRAHHETHPCVAWAALYGGNYAWLYRLGSALLDEYTYRFNRIHACTPVMRTLELLPPPLLDTQHMWCDAPCVFPSEFIVGEDAVTNYQNYYRNCRSVIMNYTRRSEPTWLRGA